jgi:hypothetical protein
MSTQNNTSAKKSARMAGPGQQGSPVYGLGMIGAWVYFWRKGETPAEKALGLAKGLVWPAFLVYGAFEAVGGRPAGGSGGQE